MPTDRLATLLAMARTTNRMSKIRQPETSPKAGSSGSGHVDSKNEYLSWPYAIMIAIVAFVVSYKLTVFVRQINPTMNENHHKQDIQYSHIKTLHPQPCSATDFIAEVEVPGLHLVCFDDSQNDELYILNIYRNSVDKSVSQFKINQKEKDPFNLIRRLVEKEIGFQHHSINHWEMFTPQGKKISNFIDMLKSSTILIYEGGCFIWPGIKIGHKQIIQLSSSSSFDELDDRIESSNHNSSGTLIMETLSMKPLIFSIDHFLSDQECDYIQFHAAPKMASSGVSLMDKDVGKKATEWRTSQTYFMASKSHQPLLNIDARVASLTRVPESHQELVQVLKYGSGAKYDAHHDYFDARLYSKDKRTLEMIQNGKTNRMATVLWYLSDVEDGGFTVFPQFGGVSPPRNMASCEQGLKVKPSKGKVIMFYSLNADGTLDRNSLHGSCPVIGEKPKWAANKWVWSSPMTAFGITN